MITKVKVYKSKTFTGCPVQYLSWNQERRQWDIQPAVIAAVNGSQVSIATLVPRRVIKKAIHEDFVKDGVSVWRHLPKKSPGGQYSNRVVLMPRGPGDVKRFFDAETGS